MSLIKNVLGFIVIGLLFAVFALLFLMPGTYNINNGSMQPTITVDTKVYTVGQSEYQVGDIIAFKAHMTSDQPKIVVTHRLIGFNDDGSLITKGDANDSTDAPAMPVVTSDVLGKVVWQVPFIGGVQTWMGQNLIFIVMMAVGLGLLAFLPKRKLPDTEKQDDSASAEPIPEKTSESHPV
jgi:signal peptidase